MPPTSMLRRLRDALHLRDDLGRRTSSPSTRRPVFGASIAHAPRTSSTPPVVWQASAGHRSNEPAAG